MFLVQKAEYLNPEKWKVIVNYYYLIEMAMINDFMRYFQHLYQQGGRAFWIHNTGPIGCLPVNPFYKHNLPPGYLDQYGCVKDQNDMAIEFNTQLKDRVMKLRIELPEASITYVDVTNQQRQE